ncbi:hypothetical protein PC129_g19148 [Phytophthora cactorum]|uniref:Uncharacterized protein n=1 Tax=Phytophthora cactorum TaxID=29920 RepID=A0A8T1HD03_9STRA|nr:hypothetical protein PC119_g19511 [Phytophthora cactorum]KAG3058191.1 hypothetical protein PC122_g20778 [Phytophthora cactorum]KAG3209846.1 hypothetical protein PC129_g19148 [Phytophthora cactorum]KAG4229227.1 hypothetical protein PC116_g22443 [Phytophthora cactorum]
MIDAPVGITATTIPRPRQGVALSMDPSRPSLQPVGSARGDVPMVTPAYATSGRRTQSGEGVPASGLSHQGSGQAQGLVQSGVERPGAAGGRGTIPVQSTVTPTVGTGTSTANPALQAFLVDTLGQVLQRFSVMSGAPTLTLRAQATAPVSHHMATSAEYTRAEPDRLMRSPMAGHLGSVSPRWRCQLRRRHLSECPWPQFLRMEVCPSKFQAPTGTRWKMERSNGVRSALRLNLR